MDKKLLGTSPEGRNIHSYSFFCKNGASFCVMDYGAALLSLNVASKNGSCSLRDVVLGYDKLEDYFDNGPCFGVVIGPHANRIVNASFELNGKEYHVTKNDGNNFNHAGPEGWHKRVWDVKSFDEDGITFEMYSPDGDCGGFPGGMKCEVSYTFKDNALIIDYRARADNDGVFSPTNHSYFNLEGHDSGTIEGHSLIVYADAFLPGGKDSVTRGEVRDVTGTPFDFTEKKKIGRDINSDYDEIVYGKGYDHCFVLNRTEDEGRESFGEDGMRMYHAAKLSDSKGELVMDVYTTQPGMMMYTANWLTEDDIAKGGRGYQARAGVAFETQFFPNALNIPDFEQPVIHAGEKKHYRSVFAFS